MALYGIDVSEYVTDIDPVQLRLNGCKFGSVRCWRALAVTQCFARGVGAVRRQEARGLHGEVPQPGNPHSVVLLLSPLNGIRIIDEFLQDPCVLRPRAPALDLESLSQGKVPVNAGPWTKAALDYFEGITGVRPVVYASTSYMREMIRQEPTLKTEKIWIAEYHTSGTADSPPKPEFPYVAWQFAGDVKLDGVYGARGQRRRLRGRSLRALCDGPATMNCASCKSRRVNQICDTPSQAMKLLLPPLVVLGTFAALLLFTDGCGSSQPSAAQPNPAAALCIAHRTTKELECVDLNVDSPPSTPAGRRCRAKSNASTRGPATVVMAGAPTILERVTEMARKRVTSSSIVYTASAWWPDNDPSMGVITTTEAKAKSAMKKLMREEARRAYDDESYPTIREAETDIRWSGIHTFSLKDLVSGREMDDAIRDLESDRTLLPRRILRWPSTWKKLPNRA